ncbi:MAG: PAS domain S-box protein, partial [Thermodesulfobacteriota bacterium]
MANEKILIVEDDENLAQYIKFTLNNLGFEIPAVVSSGEEAIQKAAETKPDLVLMDIVLKGNMDGIEAAEQIRTRFDIPFVYLTGYADNKTFRRAKITEPFLYLLKPFQKRELHTAIEMAIYKHMAERRLKESQTCLATTLKCIGDGVIVTDTEGCIRFMNPVAELLTGWNQDDAIGKNLSEVFNLRDQEEHDITDIILTHLNRNGDSAGVANHSTLIASDGTETQIEHTATSIKDEKGEAACFVIVFRRATESNPTGKTPNGEQEELEMRFLEQTAELEESNKALQDEINERNLAEEVFREHFAELSKKNMYQTITSSFTKSIHQSANPEEVLESAVEVIINNLDDADNVSIFLVEGQEAVLKAYRGYPDWFIEKIKRTTYPKGFIWKTIIEEKPILCADVEQDTALDSDGKELGVTSYISMPICSRGKVVGCVNINSLKKNAFAEEELKLLETVAQQIEIAINNAERVEAMRQSEERYRILFDQSPVGIFIFDKEFKITQCNERLAKILESSRDEIIGLDMRSLKDQSLLTAIERTFGGESLRFETLYEVTTATESLWLSVSLSPLRDNNGEVIGGMSVVEDKTESKRIEDAFTEEKERLSVILQSIGDGLIVTDTRGKIIIMNKVAEDITGWHKEEAFAKSIEGIFLIINKKTRQLCENPIEKTIKTGWTGGLSKDTVLITRNKEEKFVSASSSSIRDKPGKLIGVVLVFRDITERKKIEEELLKAQKIESLNTLAEGLAHDFNNILTGILGNVSLAKMYINPTDKINKILTEAERSCFRAAHLTKQLITFSSGGTSIKKVTSVKELIKVSTGFALRGSNVTSEFSIPEDLWLVEIDERQISQVMYNLVINAQQAMAEGGVIKVIAENVTIGAGNMLPVREGKYVKITLEDRGVGIPEENLPRVFDPYFTTKLKRSGLGLATAYSIIRNHDGYVDVESKLGVGTK